MERKIVMVLCGMLFVGGLMGGGVAMARSGSPSPKGGDSSQVSNESEWTLSVVAESGGGYREVSREEQFEQYKQFGLTYDAGKNELLYKGKAVRWFEDYYTVEEGAQAGTNFFDENGVVDVYAIRDFSNIVRSDDGSYDPSGKLIGVAEFSEKEFAARDIEAIRNPAPQVAMTGEPPTEKELKKMAKEYETFDLTYDIRADQWYFGGEKVRYFQDVLTSNGESLINGGFHGTVRSSWNESGTVDIYTNRDYANPNASGNGTLTGIEKFSQEEFDEHTRWDTVQQSSSGTCVVITE